MDHGRAGVMFKEISYMDHGRVGVMFKEISYKQKILNKSEEVSVMCWNV